MTDSNSMQSSATNVFLITYRQTKYVSLARQLARHDVRLHVQTELHAHQLSGLDIDGTTTIVDLSMPSLDVLTTLARLCVHRGRTRLVLLAACNEDMERAAAFELGNDACISAPLVCTNLLSVLRTPAQPVQKATFIDQVFESPLIRIDPRTRTAFRGQAVLNLTGAQYTLL
ncbi:hypothetical protein, partial [Caballeronia sp. LZ003]|uniref:hypothetical protein n=1 Tax=unclassified Caballeronia TaxID=2646786 RepID=UPI00285953C9|nr:hypothetical protein [Caballeronia sp. LZ002]MDR5852152.1 hypothetical protein [Caballeronia sp. LZ003]